MKKQNTGREIPSENSRGQYLKLAGYGMLGFLSILKLDVPPTYIASS